MLPSAEQLTGKVGLGATILLSGYLIVDSRSVGLFEMVQKYSGTASWGVIIAVPTVVVSYILGVLGIEIAQMLLGHLSPFRNQHSGSDLLLVGSAPDVLQSAYLEAIRRMELLQGAIVAFLVLALGCLVDRRGLHNVSLGWILTAQAIVLSVLSGIFAARAAGRASRLVGALRQD